MVPGRVSCCSRESEEVSAAKEKRDRFVVLGKHHFAERCFRFFTTRCCEGTTRRSISRRKPCFHHIRSILCSNNHAFKHIPCGKARSSTPERAGDIRTTGKTPPRPLPTEGLVRVVGCATPVVKADARVQVCYSALLFGWRWASLPTQTICPAVRAQSRREPH